MREMIECTRCNAWGPAVELHMINKKNYCSHCLPSKTEICIGCGERFTKENIHTILGDPFAQNSTFRYCTRCTIVLAQKYCTIKYKLDEISDIIYRDKKTSQVNGGKPGRPKKKDER